MASASNIRVPRAEPAYVGVHNIPLQGLPFPAAVINQNGTVVAANREWTDADANCGPGKPFQYWCLNLRSGSPDFAGILAVAADRVFKDGVRFVLEYGADNRFLVTIASCSGGALVFHQDLRPPESPRHRAQKMEIMGRLVGGVAHDFANVITLIEGYSDILLNRIVPTDPHRGEVEEIRNAARHGARLVAQLLGFTRGKDVELAELDLNLLIAEMQRMLRPIIGEYVRLEAALSVNLRKVVADRGQMEQVIVNLILNARDAMPGGGSIRIGTANIDIDTVMARQHGMSPGPGVVLSISDTGCGIGGDALAHVFDPFFTTKEKGKGTGLGLSTVRDIIRQRGGDIWVRSELGHGSIFTICLPSVPKKADTGNVTTIPQPAQMGDETVLLVEDEESVRRLLTHVLHKRGYQVLEAANAEEALSVFDQRRADIDLVLTDVVMPGMSGPAMAEKLRERSPETPIIFMSGYTDDVLARTGALSPGVSFLQKPLRPDVLAARLREALDSPSRPFNPR